MNIVCHFSGSVIPLITRKLKILTFPEHHLAGLDQANVRGCRAFLARSESNSTNVQTEYNFI